MATGSQPNKSPVPNCAWVTPASMIHLQNLFKDVHKIMNKNILYLNHILSKWLDDPELIFSDNQFILFDNKSFLAAPECILNLSIS